MTTRSLAQSLRVSAITDDAIELCISISAELVLKFWKASDVVDVRPNSYRDLMGFTVFVADKPVVSFSPSYIKGDTLTPAVATYSMSDRQVITDHPETTGAVEEIAQLVTEAIKAHEAAEQE